MADYAFGSNPPHLVPLWHQVVPRDDHQSVEENCGLDGNSVGKFLLVYRPDLGKNRTEAIHDGLCIDCRGDYL
jgi:hypothetical protein